jgi:V8-like Glu-specific endopeptidase
MPLSGSQYQQLRDALVDAFREERLIELLKFRLDKDFYRFKRGSDYDAVVFYLIQDAQAQGWVDKLVAAARESNPGNPELWRFAQEYNLAISMPSTLSGRGALERTIKKTNSFLDVNIWREKLGKIEAQVCKVEITKNNNTKEYGTGFLIAPNVVMTNYHVIESVDKGQATPRGVILRFDYKRLGDGNVINNGTEYRLEEEDWLIDKSPYSETPLLTLDELDYALLRIDGEPGNKPIGENPEPNSQNRGWIKLPEEAYEFSPNTPMLIVQHPKGDPLKLVFETEAIIGVNENRTTVQYRTNTEPGSSGSPCFDINWNLVALHHSGDPDWRNPQYNAGTPLSAICERLERQELLEELRSGEPLY